MSNTILEIPPEPCPGCDGRDRIIQTLALEIDRLNGVEIKSPEAAQAAWDASRTWSHAERYCREEGE